MKTTCRVRACGLTRSMRPDPMVLPMVTEAAFPPDMPNEANSCMTMPEMELAAMASALMCPRMAVWAACATPQRAPLIITGRDTRT